MSENEQNLDNLEVEQNENEETGEGEAETAKEAEKAEPKKKLTPEQEIGLKRRQFSKLAKELGVEVEKPWAKKAESEPAEKGGFNDTENLLLDIKNVHEEDREWLFNEHKSTGKGLRDLLSFKYVQEYLNERKKQRETENALPSGNNRSGEGGGNTAEVWLAKIESGRAKLFDIPDFKTRSEVVKLRELKDKSSKNRPDW